jgi:hypothetical protein
MTWGVHATQGLQMLESLELTKEGDNIVEAVPQQQSQELHNRHCSNVSGYAFGAAESKQQ